MPTGHLYVFTDLFAICMSEKNHNFSFLTEFQSDSFNTRSKLKIQISQDFQTLSVKSCMAKKEVPIHGTETYFGSEKNSFYSLFLRMFFLGKIETDYDSQGECRLSRSTCVWLFVSLWTIAHQTPLSMEFSKLEYWSDSHALRQVIFLTQG